MFDDYALEQAIAYKILSNSVKNDKISHAYLFETNNYQKGFDMALSFAKHLLCNKNHTTNNIYGNFNSNNDFFPELKIVEPDGLWIKKEQLDNLQKEFSKKSIDGGYQIYIINQAEKLNVQASNSILKFLEEPEPNIIAILVTNNKFSLLDTIISRCQIISLKETISTNSNMSNIEKIANHLFNNTETINNFLEEKKNEQIVSKVLEFVTYFEKNRLDTLLFSNKLWHSVIKDKEDMLNGFSIMILFYKDILSLKTNNTTNIFDCNEDMIYIKDHNSETDLCRKISTLIKSKDKIKYNVNSSLLIDGLVLEMGKTDD